MLRRIAFLSAAVAASAVLTIGASASNGGVVGNVVGAGENIVNNVVRAGENVVDDVTGAVTGDHGGTANGTVVNNGAAGVPDEVPHAADDSQNITDNGTQENPSTGVPFAYGALAALALGGAGMALTFRKGD